MLKHNIDTEYDSWLLEQAQLLRDRNFQHLDIDNLVETKIQLGRYYQRLIKMIFQLPQMLIL